MELLGHIKGIVRETGENGRVRVTLPEYDGLVTDWLPVVQGLTFGTKTWTVPRIDTQVIVLLGFGLEDAVVIGAVYSQADKAPFDDAAIIGMTADDGTEISYDPGSGKLTIQSPRLIKIVAAGIEIQSDISIKGETDIQGGIKHNGDLEQSGNYKLTGGLKHSGTLTTDKAVIGGIDFGAHKHMGVQSGPGFTGIAS
jgi:phage baseplate assembly protein V